MSLEDCRNILGIDGLWSRLGLEYADKVQGVSDGRTVKIRSPFREDKNPSMSVWVQDGVGFWKDHGTDDGGDEVKLIEFARNLTTKEAIALYHELAGVDFGGKSGGGDGKKFKKKAFKKAVKKEAKKAEKVEKKKKAPRGPLGKPVAIYDYVNPWGKVVHQTLRFEPKTFRQRRPAMAAGLEMGKVIDGWVWSLGDIEPVIYRLPEVLDHPLAEPLYLVEGEKDVESLEKIGLRATTMPMGAGKWRASYEKYFKDRWVVVMEDYDPPNEKGERPGEEGARKVGLHLLEVAERVSVVKLKDLWKQAKEGQDVSDWVEWCLACEITVDDAVDALEAAANAEAARLPEWVVMDGVYDKGGDKLEEDLFVRRFIRWNGLMFCAADFWEYDCDGGIWERIRGKLGVQRMMRDSLRRIGAAGLITKNKITSLMGLAMSERAVDVGELNVVPQGSLAVRNGVLDVERGKLVPHRQGWKVTVQCPHVYTPGAKCEEWVAWVEDRQDDEETRELLQEMFGYCLMTDVNYHRFFFLYGDGGTGKSTCVNVLEWLIGEMNRVSVELTELDNAFQRSQLVGRSLYLCKELTARSFKHIGLIKSIVAGDPIPVDVKYGEGFSFCPRGRFVMESNVLASTPDSSGGFERRFIQIDFSKKIKSGTKIVYGFEKRFKEEMSGILNWALAGYKRLKERGDFQHTVRSQQATDELLRHRAQVPSYLASKYVLDDATVAGCEVTTQDIYSGYQMWCEDNDVVAFYKDLPSFMREAMSRKKEWKARKKRKLVDGERVQVVSGVSVVRFDEEI